MRRNLLALALGLIVLACAPTVLAQQGQDKLAPPPCAKSPHGDFDFWVGTWDVFSPDGNQVGTNTITREMKGCMLHENWTSARGNTGQSINYVDPETGAWKQLWVDGSGGLITLTGALEDGAMVLDGHWIQANGQKARLRGSWTPMPDGRVRQHFESSSDGSEWKTWFDGYYKRRE